MLVPTRLRSWFINLAAGLAAASCLTLSVEAVAADPAPKAGGALEVVKLAWGPGASWDFAYAQHVDLWQRFGLKIDMVEGANGAALLSFLGSGEIQTATMAPSAMIVANSIGINLRVVYADASTTKLGLYANPASGMTADPKTWKGKNIGVAKNSQADYALRGQHAKVDCEKCHAKFKFTPIKFGNCVDCHKDEHFGQFGSRTCDDCHTVERADFALRDFDHRKTDYPLVGPHKRVPCEGCHGNGTKARYVDLPHDRCETCHADPHRGQFKPRDCDACHSPLADKFSRGAVDHDATAFPLRLAHADVACSECHGEGRKAVFKGLKFEDCAACHDDAHDARFGAVTCNSCHTDGKWEVENFDHARTSFLLTGKHVQVACKDCHGEGDKRVLFPLKYGECADCHASDDPHKSESTTVCTDCHSTVDWTAVTFAHGDITQFPLVGKHAQIPCSDCHKERAMVKLDMTCASCHEEDRPDPHFEGECGSCHLADGWMPATLGIEQHAGTGFALHGSHLNVTCAACHEGATTASPFCADCHADDEPHRNELGNACGDCHTTTDWFFVRFNHATTGWPLRGVHQIAACVDCHATGYVGTPTACRRCHESDHPNDSLHSDPLAADCELCHRPYAWEPARSPHGSD